MNKRLDARAVRRFAGHVVLAALALCWAGIARGEDEAAGDGAVLRKEFQRLSHEWRGRLSIYRSDGSCARGDAVWLLGPVKGGESFAGELTVSGVGSEVRLPVSIERDEKGGYSARFGSGSAAWRVELPRDAYGQPKKQAILWTSATGGFSTELDEEGFQLTVAGRLPLPEDRLSGAVWTSAAMNRGGFHFMLGPFPITLMECLGIFANLFFASRFVVQWIASERAKKSVMPEIFWWLSLMGAVILTIYAIYFGRFAVLLGQATGWIVYIRNIWLIEKEKRHVREVASAYARAEKE